jgi:hypothetical protein
MATEIHTSLRFDIGECRKYPGEKLPPGDPRWGPHTHSFAKETHTIESLAKAIAVDGYAICGVMKDDHRKCDNFVSSQHLGLDCDQETWDSSIEGLQADPFIADYAAIIHGTVSSTLISPAAGSSLFLTSRLLTRSSTALRRRPLSISTEPQTNIVRTRRGYSSGARTLTMSCSAMSFIEMCYRNR